jgi:hypothetical protein
MEASDQLHAPAALRPGVEPPSTHWIGGTLYVIDISILQKDAMGVYTYHNTN